MLKHLHIKHFTLISELDLEFEKGLTVITGETGAGKSIIIDALEVALGGRADATLIQMGHERCEITASFVVDHLAEAKQWLINHDLNNEDQECIIRRIIGREQRSRSTINGTPCSTQQVRELQGLIVHIHGQNQHSLLLKNYYQAQLLDKFALHPCLLTSVSQAYNAWRQVNEELNALQDVTQDHSAKIQLLNFQIQELTELGLRKGELAKLEMEHQKLSHTEQWKVSCHHIITLLADDEQSAVLTGLHSAGLQLKNLGQVIDSLQIAHLLNESVIQISEVVAQIRHALNDLEQDPERLHELDQRLSKIYTMARKYKVDPQVLHEKLHGLEAELAQWVNKDERMQVLQESLINLVAEYKLQAQQLTHSRQMAAKQLSQLVTAEMRKLGMLDGRFEVQLMSREVGTLHAQGNERIEFLVSANPGQALQPLNKVASGGELSRISLAIQVMTAKAITSSTLIFDEVDVGVGGKTAEIVGQQLRKLGENAQVFCVTHLPQVAAQGRQHLHVQKQTINAEAEISIVPLGVKERVQEIARMLGGVKVTAKTIEHAKEMLAGA